MAQLLVSLCIAENNDPPKTPATPSIWNGCIKMFEQCYVWALYPILSSFLRSLGLYHKGTSQSREILPRHSWSFITRSGSYALVSEPSNPSELAWLLIGLDIDS